MMGIGLRIGNPSILTATSGRMGLNMMNPINAINLTMQTMTAMKRSFTLTTASANTANNVNVNAVNMKKEERVRRAILNIPGSEEKKLLKSESPSLTELDCVVLDLEDGVALNKKEEARKLVTKYLDLLKLPDSIERVVRINSIDSNMALMDLTSVLTAQKIQGILIPKVESADHISFVTNIIDSMLPPQRRSEIRILAAIESARGLINLSSIANVATYDNRLDALIFASEDFVADIGMTRTKGRQELLYGRSQLVVTAAAFNLQAIDLVCVDYKNMDVLGEECIEGKHMGFTGKQAIHPDQVKTIQELFSPSSQEQEKARRIIEGYNNHLKVGLGAFNLDGKMIDLPVVKWAEKILARAKKAGLNPK